MWLLVLLLALGCGGQPAPDNTQGSAGFSEERKAQIRRFWEVYNRATSLRLEGQWEEAASQYQEALALDPRHEDSLYYLGNAFFELGRFAEAAQAWRRLVETNPTQSSRAHAQLGMLHSCGEPGTPFDLDQAERELHQALAINKEESGPVIKLGEVALLRGDRQQALEYLSAGRNLNFKSVQAHYLIGYLKWSAGDPGGAFGELKQAADFALAAVPPPEASGEGDTKKKGPLLAKGVGSRGLLTAYWKGLDDWPKDAVNPARVEAEYRRFDQRLREVWRQFGGGAR
jgi:tetratricopeptide (TPR) repeat protein